MANFIGGTGDDTFIGDAGNDTAKGNGGNDTLSGGDGQDTLEGDGGADVLDGGGGNDRLYSVGPLGSSAIPLLDRGTEVDTLKGGDGDDRLSAGYSDNVDGGDALYEYDSLYISFQGATSGVTFDLHLASQTIGGGTIKSIESAAWIEGSEFDDILIDNRGAGIDNGEFFGMGGNDRLVGGDETGTLDGGDGNDYLDGRLCGIYLDRLDGGAGNDTIYTNDDIATAYGGDGSDLIYGNGEGLVLGGAGNDTITLTAHDGFLDAHGEDGDDDISTLQTEDWSSQALYGDAGNDRLRGGSGSDRLEGGAGNDTITGGGNNLSYGDVANYSGSFADYRITEDAMTHLVTVVDLRNGSPDGTDTIDRTVELLRFSDGIQQLAGLLGVDFTGGTGADTYSGTEADNTAFGNGGNDTLSGNGGHDILEGGSGADRLVGGAGNDTLASAVLSGVYQKPVLNGVYQTPLLDRTTGIDTLVGGDGDDRLSAGYGDNVDGGAGSDTLIISFQGASKGVKIDLNQAILTIGGGTIQGVENIDWIEGSEFGDTILGGNAGAGAGYNYDGPMFGMGGDDNLTSGGHTPYMDGGNGNDLLDGRYSVTLQRIVGGAGNDTIYMSAGTTGVAYGDDGDDLIKGYGDAYGGAGNDTIKVRFNVATVHGDDGNDSIDGTELMYGSLYGDAGNDTITGSDNGDLIDGGSGADALYGGTGNDTMSGGSGDDTYFVNETGDITSEAAGQGRDLVMSTATFVLSDNIENLSLLGRYNTNGTGNALDNVIYGSSGKNILRGGAGNDALVGGGGDTLYGEDGDDRLYYEVSEILTPARFDGGSGTDTLVRSGLLDPTTFTSMEILEATGTITASVATMNGFSHVRVSEIVYPHTSRLSLDLTDGGRLDLSGKMDAGASVHLATSGLGNEVVATDGADLLAGSSNDTLCGGLGNDTYYLIKEGTVLIEQAGAGIDVLATSVSYTLPANIENLILDNSNGTTGRGNELNNVMTGSNWNNALYGDGGEDKINGGGGNDLLDGGSGADAMVGGAGHDTYVVDSAGDTVIEAAGKGTDLVQSAINFALSDNVENLTLIGSALSGTGNVLANALTGNAGNNYLDGGAGNDTMSGGAGDDSYIVDSSSDVVTEAANEGTDLVTASASFVLGANVENLILTGSAASDGKGNGLGNMLTGNDASNRLDGGAGNDTLTGGAGDDSYVVDAAGDVVTEAADQGVDLVLASSIYVLGDNIENLTLTGTGAIDGTGNGLANLLTGNSGDNRLDGGLGFDTLAGGLGNDTYVVDSRLDVVTELSGEGADTVRSSVDLTLGDNLENLVLTGTADLRGYGNGGNNTVTGNSGANLMRGLDGNDVLDGGLGLDAMYGGVGDDTYYVDNAGDLAREYADEGTDTIFATVSFNIAATAVENLTLLGTGDLDATGSRFANTLTGNGGANRLDGGGGTDTLVGGAGDDTYVVWQTADIVVEASGGGIDTVQAIRSYALTDHVENLTLIGTGSTAGVGNGLDNVITGNSGSNRLTGGAGADTFVFLAGSGADRIWDFHASEGDLIDISAYSHGVVGGGGVSIIDNGPNTLIDLGGGNVITVYRTHANDAAFLSHIVW